jgi:hypothetical protein
MGKDSKIEKAVWDVCSEVDWSKIEDTMNHLQWYWYEDMDRTPNVGTLMKHAVNLGTRALNTCSEVAGESYTIGSGGIMVEAKWYDGRPYLKVWFEVSSSDNYD